jgi:hypothetical protein
MGTMADGVDQRKVVRDLGTKGKQHEAKFKSLENLIVLANVE